MPELASASESGRYPLQALRDPRTDPEIVASLHYDISSSEWILNRLHRAWFEDLLWYYGEHYLDWNPASRRFQPRPGKQLVPRATTNLIYPMVEIGMQLFLDSLPKVHYVPTTPDQSDRNAADVATGIMRYRDGESRMSAKKRELAGWVVNCGTGYMQAAPDKFNADRIKVPRMVDGPPDPETGEPTQIQATDETGAPAFDEVVMWDEGCEVISPFEIAPDWSARNAHEWQRYTHVRARSRDWIGQVFGSDAREKAKPEAVTGTVGTMGYYQIKVLDIQMRAGMTGSYGLPYGYGGAIADFKYMEDSAVVMTRYELPNDRHPDGRYLVVCGSDVLANEPNPHGNKLNLFTFGWSVLPGSLFRFGMVRNLAGPQKRLNGIDTQMDYIRKTMGSPRIIAERRSQVALDLTTADPAHIITYRGRGGIPEPRAMPAIGSDADARYQREAIPLDMERISGIRPPLTGTNPTGVTAGVALEMLTEQAGKRFQAAVEDNREEFKRLYQMRIEIAQESNAWKVPRAIPMIGSDNTIQMRDFQAADFKGNLTVDIEAVPITALTQVIKKQTVGELIDRGLIDVTSQENRDKVRSLYGVSEFTDPVSVHVKMAQEENARMLLGQPVSRQPFDADPIHLEQHIGETKTARFQGMPGPVRQLFYQHIQEHQAADQQAKDLRAQAYRAKMMEQGAGAPPPEGPQAPPEGQEMTQ